MECLIKHKTDDKMDEKCAAGIEHHQLVSLGFYFVSWSVLPHAYPPKPLEEDSSGHLQSLFNYSFYLWPDDSSGDL